VVALLRAVQAKYRICYLSTGADQPSRYNKLRAWLERAWVPAEERFPDGPVLARGSRVPLPGPATYLHDTLQHLKQRFRGTLAGIAAKESHAHMINEAGWRAFLLSEPHAVSEGTTTVPSWNDLSRQFP
jgi:hypothetical protein